MAEPAGSTPAGTTASDEFPRLHVLARQIEKYRFELEYQGTSLPRSTVDEGPPLGSGAGPDPALALAGAVAHCLSSTLFNTLERSRVKATPLRTSVVLAFGRNAKGRKRVASMDVSIECAPVEPADRERFDRAKAIFEDYCTVTGSVREGVLVRATVRPSADGGRSAAGTTDPAP